MRQSIITLFLSRFTLSADEKDAIASREVPVGPRFFAAMEKAAKIRDDCRVLMTGDEGDTKAGIDILSATATQLEQAYDKIFRHCSFEFRQMGRDATLDVDPAMREAVRRLRQRPELLTYVYLSVYETLCFYFCYVTVRLKFFVMQGSAGVSVANPPSDAALRVYGRADPRRAWGTSAAHRAACTRPTSVRRGHARMGAPSDRCRARVPREPVRDPRGAADGRRRA